MIKATKKAIEFLFNNQATMIQVSKSPKVRTAKVS